MLLDGLDDPRVYVNRDVTARYGRDRDETLVDGDGLPCPVETFTEDGVVRGTRDGTAAGAGRQVEPTGAEASGTPADSRDGWADQCEAYLEADPRSVPAELPGAPAEGDVTVEGIEDRYEVDPDERLPRPGKAPLPVLDEAGVELGADYPYPVVDYERRASEASEGQASLDEF